MPILKKAALSDFRNIEFQELEFSPNINCISGSNGEGKTNLLEAIYYLSMTKSSQSVGDIQNYRYGSDGFTLRGDYTLENGLETRVVIRSDASGKTLRRDDKPLRKASDHIGRFPTVMVSPYDSSLVSESGEQRRRFLNGVISQLDQEYLNSLLQYNKVLSQRNKLLKDSAVDFGLLEALDLNLAKYAEPVYKARKEFASRLLPIVERYYQALSSGKEKVGISYEGALDRGPLEQQLHNSLQRDLALHFTSIGVQRDELIFQMNGRPIRTYGSQGQQKSFLVALKFAQYELMRSLTGIAPTLLLDDVFDKLDLERISNLLEMVSKESFGQIFLTDCDRERLQRIVDKITSDRRYFVVTAGVFETIDG